MIASGYRNHGNTNLVKQDIPTGMEEAKPK
jgi:hypothetical protein